MREIRAAYEAWTGEIKRAEDAAGITEPMEAGARESDLIDSLRRAMAAVPARTSDGILAKARIASLSLSDCPSWIEEERLLDGSKKTDGPTC